MTYINLTRSVQNPALQYFLDLWRYRALCLNLVSSDLRSRFRRSKLGLVWAILQPLAFSLIVAVVWSTIFQAGTIEYGIFVFSGMIVWEYTSNNILVAQDSLIQSEGYLKQGRIPLLIFQLRSPLAGIVTFLAGFVGLLGLLGAVGQLPELGPHLLYIPAFIAVMVVFSIPLAILFSLLGTQFRDLRHATAIILNGLFFLSPVMVAREYLYTPELAWLEYVNPLLPILELFRAPIFENQGFPLDALAVVGVWTAALWIIALSVKARLGRRIIFAL